LKGSLPEAKLGFDLQDCIAPEKITLAAARGQLLSAISQSAKVPRVADVSRALDQYCVAISRLLFKPLYDDVHAACSPLDNFSNLTAGELMEHWFKQDRLVLQARTILAGNHPAHCPETDSDWLDERLKIANQIHKLLRHLSGS
jgi:hypothetical protein